MTQAARKVLCCSARTIRKTPIIHTKSKDGVRKENTISSRAGSVLTSNNETSNNKIGYHLFEDDPFQGSSQTPPTYAGRWWRAVNI
mmetsp:Transcript_38095/g.113804  ORF Transcript_38095/g.113804 Transcript_38095/m.113804 type:complete len:86 (+) Transcript_38095:1535-1792(+)